MYIYGCQCLCILENTHEAKHMRSPADTQTQRKTPGFRTWLGKNNSSAFRVVFFQLTCSTALKGRCIKCGGKSKQFQCIYERLFQRLNEPQEERLLTLLVQFYISISDLWDRFESYSKVTQIRKA